MHVTKNKMKEAQSKGICSLEEHLCRESDPVVDHLHHFAQDPYSRKRENNSLGAKDHLLPKELKGKKRFSSYQIVYSLQSPQDQMNKQSPQDQMNAGPKQGKNKYWMTEKN